MFDVLAILKVGDHNETERCVEEVIEELFNESSFSQNEFGRFEALLQITAKKYIEDSRGYNVSLRVGIFVPL